MEKNTKKSILVDLFRKIEIDLSERQMEQFLVYYDFLTEKNQVMNLTAITDYQEVVRKHFVDSLTLSQVCNLNSCSSVIDVGTGAGFPGVPLKIVYPHLKVVLLDSLNKRIVFLNELIQKLELTDIMAIHARAEDAAKMTEYRERFDLCVSRAVANLSSLLEYSLPFVKVNGMFVSYKSTDINSEIENAQRALHILGGKIKRKTDFLLPESDIRRSLLLIEKIKATPSRYPRKAGIPSKEPL